MAWGYNTAKKVTEDAIVAIIQKFDEFTSDDARQGKLTSPDQPALVVFVRNALRRLKVRKRARPGSGGGACPRRRRRRVRPGENVAWPT